MPWSYDGVECKFCGKRYKDTPERCECGEQVFFKIFFKPAGGKIKVEDDQDDDDSS